MSRFRPRRPFLRSLMDGLVLAALLAMIALALRLSGGLAPESGAFIAVDGDSLRKAGADFRLYGIDAPELHQRCQDAAHRDYGCGQNAKAALQDIVAGQTLNCTTLDTDRYGRQVAQCRAGSLDINGEMVRLGWAIAYRKHSLAYIGQEDEARRDGRGLWQGRFENPEAWRARHRNDIVRGGLSEDSGEPD